MVSHRIENQIVALPASSEILLGVIDHLIRADRSDHLHIPGAAYAGHVGPERLGDLYRERTHASRRAIYQDLLPWLDVSLVAQTLKCGQRRDRDARRLLKGQVTRLRCQPRLGSTRILGKSASGHPENLIARFEPGNLRPNGFNPAGHVRAEPRAFGSSHPRHQMNHIGRASHEVKIVWIDGCGPNFYQDLFFAGGWLFNLGELKNVGRTVAVINDRLHECIHMKVGGLKSRRSSAPDVVVADHFEYRQKMGDPQQLPDRFPDVVELQG